MARRRMFSLDVIETDRFIDMDTTARLLYYELGMRADDEGFVSSPKMVIRTVGCSKDDLDTLIHNGFVIGFDSGVIVITHWNRQNNIPKDRFHASICKTERSSIVDIDGVYYLRSDTDT